MLKIEDLTVEVNGKTLLRDVNLEVEKGTQMYFSDQTEPGSQPS